MENSNKKYICKYCGKEFKTFQKLGGHVSCCKLNPLYKEKLYKSTCTRLKNLDVGNPIEEHKLSCEVCGNEYVVTLRKHLFEEGKYKKTCSSYCAHKLTAMNSDLKEKNKKISIANTGKIYETLRKKSKITSKYKFCEYCGKKYEVKSKSKFCCKDCRNKSKYNKLSNIAKKCNFGGYYQNSIKKHHKGNYKGIHCDSSWELAYLVYNLEHNIPIKRCNIKRKYLFEGIEKTYFPDFIINNNQIVEIKGYYDIGAKAKQEQNPDILILFKDDLKQIFDYIINKYGNKFWEVLYE